MIKVMRHQHNYIRLNPIWFNVIPDAKFPPIASEKIGRNRRKSRVRRASALVTGCAVPRTIAPPFGAANYHIFYQLRINYFY